MKASKNPDIKYWKYYTFELNSYGDDDVEAQFWFMKRDIPCLRDALDLRNKITCHFYNDLLVDSTEALCIILCRLAYPCCYVDMVPLFGRSALQLRMIFNQTIDLMDSSHNHTLSELNQGWLSPHYLKPFADLVHRKEVALDNV